MRVLLLVLHLLVLVSCVLSGRSNQDYNADDFDEFEFQDEESLKEAKNSYPAKPPQAAPLPKEEEDESLDSPPEVETQTVSSNDDDFLEGFVEESIVSHDDEFSHFADEEEFIGFDGEKTQTPSGRARSQDEPKITITKVPLHLMSNWDSFYLEILMLAGLAVYFANFILGKNKNKKIATVWYEKNREFLESHFELVGDDGKPEIEEPGLRKESENSYMLWCSGKALVEGMLIELNLSKRQDLIGVINQILRPSPDQLLIKLTVDELDTIIFAIGTKKATNKVLKDMNDITTFCPEKRSADRFGFGSQFHVYTEVPEFATFLQRDPKVAAVFSKYPNLIDYIHISDQHSGPKPQEDGYSTPPPLTELPPSQKVLIFSFNFPRNASTKSTTFSDAAMTEWAEEWTEATRPLLQLALYLCDKLTRYRLTKEMRVKADKSRGRVQEAILKATHAARAEMAQTEREEKKRKEREYIMSLDDPEKQRRWEEKEQKRQAKKRAPKIKAFKGKP